MILENLDGTFTFAPLVTLGGKTSAALDNRKNQRAKTTAGVQRPGSTPSSVVGPPPTPTRGA